MTRRVHFLPERVPIVLRDGHHRRLVYPFIRAVLEDGKSVDETRITPEEYGQRSGVRPFKEKAHVDQAGDFHLPDSDGRCPACAGGACRTVRLTGVDISGTHLRKAQRTHAPNTREIERVHRATQRERFQTLEQRKRARLDAYVKDRGLSPEQAARLRDALGLGEKSKAVVNVKDAFEPMLRDLEARGALRHTRAQFRAALDRELDDEILLAAKHLK
jgi:hypothetical protein